MKKGLQNIEWLFTETTSSHLFEMSSVRPVKWSKCPLFDLLNGRNENGPKTIAGKRLEHYEINCTKVYKINIIVKEK